jgi:hypothetical protein
MIRFACTFFFLVNADLAPARDETALPSWETLHQEGKRAFEEENLTAACAAWVRAAGLNPWHSGIREALETCREKLFALHFRSAEELFDAGRATSAYRSLLEAMRFRPGEERGKRLLLRGGYERYGDVWLQRGDVIKAEKTQARRARLRRAQLELADRFTLRRLRSFRLWTDHHDGALLPFTVRLVRILESQERVYRDLFAPLEPEPPRGGIDVVIFESLEDYGQYTGQPGTGGVFLPERSVSCFYLPRQLSDTVRESFVSKAFLHEVTHQLDFEVLGLRFPPRWLQEGLAVHFESARLSREGRIEELGCRLPRGIELGLSRLREEPSSWWSLSDLVEIPAEKVLAGRGDWAHQYYAQAWLLVRFLTAGGPRERAAFFDVVNLYRQRDRRPERPVEDFSRILERHGRTLDQIEKQLRKALSASEARPDAESSERIYN